MRVKIINAPGYEDEWEGTLLAYVRTVDGRPVAVIESDDGSPHVISQADVREPSDGAGHDTPFYDAQNP